MLIQVLIKFSQNKIWELCPKNQAFLQDISSIQAISSQGQILKTLKANG
jgi:hypothetical protein